MPEGVLTFSDVCNVISFLLAFAAICVSLYSVREARKTALTEAYFSEMAAAYADYLRCVSDFGYRRGFEERDALSAALYRIELFASPDICKEAEDLYVYILDWAASNPTRAISLDTKSNHLAVLMREHLKKTQKSGNP